LDSSGGGISVRSESDPSGSEEEET
jgi:hypothetical protein